MIHFVTHGVSDKSRNFLIKLMYHFQFLNLVKIPNSVRLNHNQTSTYTHNNQNGHAPEHLEPKRVREFARLIVRAKMMP